MMQRGWKIKSRTTFIISFVFLLTTLFTSFGQQKAEWKGKIEYEEGVRVIVNPDKPLFGEVELELEEDLVLGNEEDENYLFSLISDIDVDKEGNIYVADMKEKRIQVYDRSGRYLKTIGRAGQGPGEFQSLSQVHICSSGEIYVTGMYRLHRFDQEGKFIESWRLGDPISYPIVACAILDEGYIMALVYIATEVHTKRKVTLLNSSGKEIKTIVEYPFEEPEPRKNGKEVSLWNPYRYRWQVLSYIDGLGLYTDSEEYKIFGVNSSGEKEFVIRKKESPSEVSKRAIEELVDYNYTNVRDNPILNKRYKLTKDEIKKYLKIPNHKAFFNFVLSDEEGNIYTLKLKGIRDLKDGLTIDVFNREGIFLNTLALKNIVPRFISKDSIYTIDIDSETDYWRVKRYKIKNWFMPVVEIDN